MSTSAVPAPASAVDRFIEYSATVNAELNVYAHLAPPEQLRAEAAESLERWRSGRPLSPLDGVLVSVKDNIARRGEPCRMGSAARAEVPATEDAPVMRNLLDAGMIVVGRTTMPDHGCKGVTHGGLHGTARNPWNPALTPGGSSGGAASSIASGLTRLAVGSDGGGSIRIPAAFTGIVGLKPTFGRVPSPTGGPFAPIGHIGPMGATVADVAALFDVLCGADAVRSAPVVEGMDVSGLRFAVWAESTATDPAIAAGVRRAADALVRRGAVAVPWSADLSDARAAWEDLFMTGAAKAVEAFAPGAPMDPVLAELAERGRALTPESRERAERQRARLRAEVAALFADIDLIVSPVVDCLPFEVEQETPPGSETTWFHEWSPCAYPFNVTGNPALSLPSGLSPTGLPTAVQLVAAPGREGLLLRTAALLETELGRLCLPTWGCDARSAS